MWSGKLHQMTSRPGVLSDTNSAMRSKRPRVQVAVSIQANRCRSRPIGRASYVIQIIALSRTNRGLREPPGFCFALTHVPRPGKLHLLMSTLNEIKAAIQSLSPGERAELERLLREQDGNASEPHRVPDQAARRRRIL